MWHVAFSGKHFKELFGGHSTDIRGLLGGAAPISGFLIRNPLQCALPSTVFFGDFCGICMWDSCAKLKETLSRLQCKGKCCFELQCAGTQALVDDQLGLEK